MLNTYIKNGYLLEPLIYQGEVCLICLMRIREGRRYVQGRMETIGRLAIEAHRRRRVISSPEEAAPTLPFLALCGAF